MPASHAPRAPRLSLNDGYSIPQIGFGVYKIPEARTAQAVGTAIDLGYRHVDTATLYGNERAVGEGIRRSGVPREEVFVTSKVWNSEQGYENTLRAFDESLRLFGFDYLDLYLIHWPTPGDLYLETWRALERLKHDGKVRSIGVSNFHPRHLERLFGAAEIVPAVNQVELHPWLPQDEIRAFDARHGIRTEAWSPLARGDILSNPTLQAIAERHGVTVAQVVVRWHVQLGTVVLPKSETPERIAGNLDVFGFELGHDDIAAIATLETGRRTGRNPDEIS